jgi:hypothetical protein
MEALCGVSTREEHTEERKWEVLGRRGHSEAILALAVPAWHRTVPYTVPYFAVITVKYGVIITVVRRNLTSTVRTVQTFIVPYRTTRQA